MEQIITFAALTLCIGILSQGVEGSCDFDSLTTECFRRMRRPSGSGSGSSSRNSNEVSLNVIIEAFKRGIPQTCDFMHQMISCIEEATTSCDGSESGRAKTGYLQMKEAVEYVCETKKQEFIGATGCITADRVVNGIRDCQDPILRTSGQTCSAVKGVIDCSDRVIQENCPNVLDSFGHLARKYLVDRLHLTNCDIVHHDDHSVLDHDHDAPGHVHKSLGAESRSASSASLLVLTILLSGLFVIRM